MTPSIDLSSVADELNRNITPEMAKGVNAVFQIDVAGQHWVLDLTRKTPPYIRPGVVAAVGAHGSTLEPPAHAAADCTLTIPRSDDWAALSDGKLSAATALFTGRLKLSGNVALAMKLEKLLSR